jgi:GntR family histidine utilization transcriptional repressor
MEHPHQRIRGDIETRIMSGEWPPGHRIPSEHEMMAQYGCSRMTVNKVISALAAQGLITRRRRAGSVVAEPSTGRAVLEIQDFSSEAARTGTNYRFEILRRSVEALNAAAAARTGLRVGAPVLSVDTLHLTEGVPSAYEQRVINLSVVPDAAHEPFEAVPPGTWLLSRVPWTDAEHLIRAVNADGALARRLKVDTGAACLVLERRTWQTGALVTDARLTYPGERYHMAGRFSPTSL